MKKSKSKSVLLIGPLPEPTTGVSLANKVVLGILDEYPDCKVSYINTSYSRFDEALGKVSLHKIIFNLLFCLKVYKVFRKQVIYITPGQTFFGVIKYAGFILLSSLLGKEIVIHIHGNHIGREYQSLSGWKKSFFYYLLSKTSKGIVLSESLKKNMSPFVPENRIYVLHNFAEDYIARSDSKKSFQKLQIIYLSNLMEEKGIYDLLKALRLIEEEHVLYEAKIAGAIDISQKDRIQQEIALLENTTYLGIVKGDEKKELLDWGNIFVLPTYYKMEGQPISILEALATRNVILTTMHAGIPDVIENDIQGNFVKKQDPKDIFEKLLTFNNSKERLQEISDDNGRYFLKNFSRLQFKETLLKILFT